MSNISDWQSLKYCERIRWTLTALSRTLDLTHVTVTGLSKIIITRYSRILGFVSMFVALVCCLQSVLLRQTFPSFTRFSLLFLILIFIYSPFVIYYLTYLIFLLSFASQLSFSVSQISSMFYCCDNFNLTLLILIIVFFYIHKCSSTGLCCTDLAQSNSLS